MSMAHKSTFDRIFCWKMANYRPFFLYYSVFYKNCRWLNSNPGPLGPEAAALPTVSQPLYRNHLISTLYFTIRFVLFVTMNKFFWVMGHPLPLFNLFSPFQTYITIFTTNLCEKCLSSILFWDSNPRPSENESPPITTAISLFYLLLN